MIKDNFNKMVEKSIRNNWDILALSDYQGNSFYYKDVAGKIIRIHEIFKNCGINKGDKVALLGKNSAAWAITFLATTTYGAVVVPLLPDFRPKDAHNIINHSDSVSLFVADSIYENLNIEEMPNIRAVFSLTDFSLVYDTKNTFKKAITKIDKDFDNKYYDQLQAENFELPIVANPDLLEILYTSGTSGIPKGVMLSHNMIASNIIFANKELDLKSGDPILSFLPMAHAYGCAFEFLYPVTSGCHITFLGKMPSPQVLLAAFKEIRPRLILAVPLIIEKIYKKRIKPALEKTSVKLLSKIPFVKNKIYKKINKQLTESFGSNFYEIVIGGAALNKEVEEILRKVGFRYTVGYGMTECAPIITYADFKETKLASCGKAVINMEIKIEKETPDAKTGEILIRGENVMYGYYKNEVLTKEILDKDGWLHSGDLGEIDEDGYLFIKGRSKSMILGASGQNIFPEELEALINNFQYAQESLVIECDGKLCALIHPDKEAVDREKISTDALHEKFKASMKALNQEVPAFMSIATFEIVDKEFEKTPKKSIKRFLYTAPNYSVHTLS